MKETWQDYLRDHFIDPAEAPYEPILKEWECHPIIQTIRDWEIITKQKYTNKRPTA